MHKQQMDTALNGPASEPRENFSTQLNLEFDYGELSFETRTVVQQRTSEIKSLLKQTAQELIEIGQKLIEVKEQLGHGNFGRWLKAEFGWGITTAWKLMKVAEAFKFSQCENLDISASAIYLLAAPSTPQAARQQALERATAGEKITYTKAKEIITEQREVAKAESDEPIAPVATQTVVKQVANSQSIETVQGLQTESTTSMVKQQTAIPTRTAEALDKSGASQVSLFLTPQMSRGFEADGAYSAITEAVLQCLDEIHLHLCNRSYHGPHIPALTQLTEENSLTASWCGSIFINLPDIDAVNDFVDKLCAEFESNHVTEALSLFTAQPGNQWFRRLRKYPRCFLNSSLSFPNINEQEFSPVMFYLGHEPEGLNKFRTAFTRLGDIFILVE